MDDWKYSPLLHYNARRHFGMIQQLGWCHMSTYKVRLISNRSNSGCTSLVTPSMTWQVSNETDHADESKLNNRSAKTDPIQNMTNLKGL